PDRCPLEGRHAGALARQSRVVMPGLVPGIHVFLDRSKDVDGRGKPGPDCVDMLESDTKAECTGGGKIMGQAHSRYLLAAAVTAALALPADSGRAQTSSDPNAAPNPYRLDDGLAKLPQGRKWGAAIGVDIDRDGMSVWVFDRCATADDCSGSNLAPIQKFDASGKLMTSFGAGLFNYPHGLF